MSDVYKVEFIHGGRGMFSIVNDLVDHLCVADSSGYKLKLAWLKSPYKSENTEEDAFAYYFEDFFKSGVGDKLVGEKKSFAFRRGNCITPRKGGLAQPIEREKVNGIIEKYIKLKPHITKKIDEFVKNNFKGYVIGLHIRGKGRLDGGTGTLRNRGELVEGVPYNLYFDKLNELLKSYDASILLCSDSQRVVDYCTSEYGDRIVTYSAIRSPGGEMHQKHGEFKDVKYELGEDVLIEAHLLSMTDYLIHGNSNVTNFVLCKNSRLKNFYIYGDA